MGLTVGTLTAAGFEVEPPRSIVGVLVGVEGSCFEGFDKGNPVGVNEGDVGCLIGTLEGALLFVGIIEDDGGEEGEYEAFGAFVGGKWTTPGKGVAARSFGMVDAGGRVGPISAGVGFGSAPVVPSLAAGAGVLPTNLVQL